MPGPEQQRGWDSQPHKGRGLSEEEGGRKAFRVPPTLTSYHFFSQHLASPRALPLNQVSLLPVRMHTWFYPEDETPLVVISFSTHWQLPYCEYPLPQFHFIIQKKNAMKMEDLIHGHTACAHLHMYMNFSSTHKMTKTTDVIRFILINTHPSSLSYTLTAVGGKRLHSQSIQHIVARAPKIKHMILPLCIRV